ncbi:MAG: hypothetical protein CM1200mP33_6670 [Chloroflexota bacterium]|nr:MAG: hypothetical protein CM1200mP33_6670 [Chloroflexota bacterium]
MTENTAVATTNFDGNNKIGTVGTIIPGTEAKNLGKMGNSFKRKTCNERFL